MALEGTIRTDVEAAFRDRAIVVMLDGTGARGAELFADPKTTSATASSGRTSISTNG